MQTSVFFCVFIFCGLWFAFWGREEPEEIVITSFANPENFADLEGSIGRNEESYNLTLGERRAEENTGESQNLNQNPNYNQNTSQSSNSKANSNQNSDSSSNSNSNSNADSHSNTNTNTNSDTASPGLINLNTATLEELDSLPGIGPATAKLILDYREQYGGFAAIEEIQNVKRIGEKTFLKLKDKICV